MHEFQNKWLNLRESVDRNSRNKRILYLINKFFKNKKNIRIVDLGSGAGSNYRFLKSRLFNNQYWSFVDISHQSTNYFKKNIKLSSKIKKTNFKIIDVINNLQKINFNDYNLVTGSAFLDILPKTWFKNAKLSKAFDIKLNRFGVKAGLTRKEWQDKGWIFKEDPLGWFQWYCRFCNGRRIPKIDEIQIKRWKNFTRHVKAIKKNCDEGDLNCRKRKKLNNLILHC